MYARAVEELNRGEQTDPLNVIHFPQIAGLGHSTMAEHAIRDLDQAKRYLDDPTLGERLRTMCV